jgi:hypothetical protein
MNGARGVCGRHKRRPERSILGMLDAQDDATSRMLGIWLGLAGG